MYKSEFDTIKSRIFLDSCINEFENLALSIFKLQYQTNNTYRQYVDFLNVNPEKVKEVKDIVFLPVSFFKDLKILSGLTETDLVFFSSGTTASNPSKHYIADPYLYKQSLIQSFKQFYGDPSEYCFLALLPGYLERQGSSLVYMVNELMGLSGHGDNGFYLSDFEQLKNKILKLKVKKQKYILIGVTYSLIDFGNAYSIDLSDGIVMETGGMKGIRKELVKAEIHEFLKSKFNLSSIHSEYGMTELLSQAYSAGDGIYSSPHWMKILIRDVYDPFNYVPDGNSGGINIIDLANLYSCAFIETKDLGKIRQNGQFEILGRFDDSDIRGCNLMVS